MECPVCKKSGLSEDVFTCPECKSDLSVLQTFGKVRKTSRTRLILAIVLGIVLLLVVVAWIISWPSAGSEEDVRIAAAEEQVATPDETRRTAGLEQLREENARLKRELEELQAKEEASYTINYGETLFGIARKIYGNGFKYRDIAEINNIENPDSITAGRKLTIYY